MGRQIGTFCAFFSINGEHRVNAHTLEAAVFPLNMLGEGQTIPAGILHQELAELLLWCGRFQIVLASLGISTVQVGGAFFCVRRQADIGLCLHELAQVVIIRHGRFQALP